MILQDGRLELTEPDETGDLVHVLLAGDFCPIRRTEEAVLAGRSTDMVASMASLLREADLSMVNLEAPLTRTETPIRKTGPNLRGDPGCVNFLVEAGFHAANLANNHILDMGSAGVLDTLATLQSQGVAAVGAGRDLESATQPLSLEIKGRRIAVLAYAENEFSIAGVDSAGAANLDPVSNLGQVHRVSLEHDCTLVLVHGGNEYCPIPSPGMRQRYRSLARAGAAAVVATHTHCPQGMEVVDGVPIVYSMGNFLFDTPWEGGADSDPDMWWKGYLVKLAFSDHSAVSVELVPYSSGPDGTRVTLLEGDDRRDFLDYLQHISGIIGDEAKRQNLWDAWCLTQGSFWMDSFRQVRMPAPDDGDGAEMNRLVVRNGFTCEAHREVVTTFLKMVCENRMDEAGAHRAELVDLQKGIWEPR